MTLRQRVGDIIFETDTKAAQRFDIVLLWAIVISVGLVILESVPSVEVRYGPWLRRLEWGFTVLFTVEYAARLWSARNALRYARSFYGVIDLVAVLPTYLALLVSGAQYSVILRGLRLLRVFRVLKAARFRGEANVLIRALRASREKIVVFLVSVLTLILVIGSVMYVVEGPEHGFDSIPTAIYWSIVTLTTVGYGDVVPQTPLGKFLASAVMIIGYAIIAVPTGIVTSELSRETLRPKQGDGRVCRSCGARNHSGDAAYCRVCGDDLSRLIVES